MMSLGLLSRTQMANGASLVDLTKVNSFRQDQVIKDPSFAQPTHLRALKAPLGVEMMSISKRHLKSDC